MLKANKMLLSCRFVQGSRESSLISPYMTLELFDLFGFCRQEVRSSTQDKDILYDQGRCFFSIVIMILRCIILLLHSTTAYRLVRALYGLNEGQQWNKNLQLLYVDVEPCVEDVTCTCRLTIIRIPIIIPYILNYEVSNKLVYFHKSTNQNCLICYSCPFQVSVLGHGDEGIFKAEREDR